MEKRQITTRQMMILLFVGMLSPTIRALPRRSVSEGGTGGWLSALVAIFPLMLVVWSILDCLHRMPKGSGLGELMEYGVGRGGARVLCAGYALWILLSVAIFLRIYSERFLSTTYTSGSIYLFLIPVLALVLWNGSGSFGAFARMGKIFFFILVLTLTLVLGMSAGQVRAEHVFPLWWQDTPDVLRASLYAAGVLGYGIFAFFLGGQTQDLSEHRGTVLRWTFGFGLLITGMQFITVGNFGAPMVSRMQVPFFMLAKEIHIYGAMERLESVIIALWVVTDVVLIGWMIRAACAAMQFAFRLSDGQTLVTPVVLGLLPASILIAGNQFALEDFCMKVANTGNLILGYGIPLIICLLARVRKRL